MSPRARFGLWLVLVGALALWAGLRTLPALRLETDISALLPQTERDPAVRQALDRFGAAAGRRNLFLVGAPDFAGARTAARAFAATLRAAPVFSIVELELPGDAAQLGAAYGRARSLLLSDRQRALLARGDVAALREAALRDLYTPSGLGRALPFAEDPFNFHGEFLAQLGGGQGRVLPREGLLVVEHAGGVDVLVSATLRDSPFGLESQATAVAALDAARAAAQAGGPQVSVLGSGVLRHAAAGSTSARREISLFGSISLAGVVLLFLLSFRSPRPLLLALGTLGVSSLASLAVTQAVFGQVHMMALVFGSSLIGVAVDYSIHFFADQFRDSVAWNGARAVAHVGAAVAVGMLTTSMGYLALLVPPFPGLRQMAVFSIAGIVSAGLCVLLAYPLLAGRGRAAPAAVGALMQRLTRLAPPRGRLWQGTLVVLAVLAALGLARLRFSDDVRTLQSSPAHLVAEEQALRSRLGGGIDTRFFLVRGADAAQVLEREEALRAHLDDAVSEGKLGGYSALSRHIPSPARQAENAALLARHVYAPGAALDTLLAQVGFGPEIAQRNRAVFAAAQPLRFEDWLSSPQAQRWKELWLGPVGAELASAVALSGVSAPALLAPLAEGLPGVRLVDRVADISAALTLYRRISLLALAGALAAIGAVLMLRYGPRAGVQHLVAPLGGALLTLATLGLLGIPANLCTVLALLLVLGLGVDYTVFLREGVDSRPTTLLAITLAGVITLLSFGMLAASTTPFIRSLGLGVLLGVLYTWLLAVLSSAPTRQLSRELAPRVVIATDPC
ncbi:MAG TPA: MMPL family transporter [Candidatus Binatia bacterium]|nr:MMPL family transporter [Candidatus Binatia bacterium]